MLAAGSVPNMADSALCTGKDSLAQSYRCLIKKMALLEPGPAGLFLGGGERNETEGKKGANEDGLPILSFEDADEMGEVPYMS